MSQGSGPPLHYSRSGDDEESPQVRQQSWVPAQGPALPPYQPAAAPTETDGWGSASYPSPAGPGRRAAYEPGDWGRSPGAYPPPGTPAYPPHSPPAYPPHSPPAYPPHSPPAQQAPPARAAPGYDGGWGSTGAAPNGYGTSDPASAPAVETPPAAIDRTQELVAAQVRGTAINRMRLMNTLHASHAWELRRSKALGPHALAFLYAVVDSRSGDERPYYEVRAAKRLFRDGDDVENLVGLLYEMVDIARGYLADGGIFDPVRQMTQQGEDIPSHATYVGTGISSLDTPIGTWKQVQRRVRGGTEIPGRCFATLTDGTRLVLDRPAEQHRPMVVHSSRPLHTSEYSSWRPLATNQEDLPTWQWLEQLHQAVMEGQHRMTAPPTSHRGGW